MTTCTFIVFCSREFSLSHICFFRSFFFFFFHVTALIANVYHKQMFKIFGPKLGINGKVCKRVYCLRNLDLILYLYKLDCKNVE